MIKPFSVLAIVLLLSKFAIAGNADSLISISSLKINCQFVYNAAQNRVEIKQTSNTTYISDIYQASLQISELFNNNVTIDNIACKVDGRIPVNFKPLSAYYSVDDYFFSDQHICYFPLMLPKKGSTASVTFNQTFNDPRYFTTLYFTSGYHTATAEVSVKVPRWMKVELKEQNFGSYDIKKNSVYDAAADADIITYTTQNLPAMKREENSPGPSYVYPHLLVLCKSAAPAGKAFTYFDKLDNQYAWYRTLVKSVVNNNAIIEAKATDLTNGLSNDIAKIKAVFYYVQDNIRYIAFEDGLAGFKPESADEVLRKKYGDCKGMANLTKCLLTSLGYDARLCWLGTDHIAYDYQTPSMAVDNHMICGLNFQGKTIFLDATETYLGMNEYAQRIQGRQILMEDGDKYQLKRVPVAPQAQNYDHQTSKLTITGSVLTGPVSHLWKGEDKEMTLAGINGV